MAVGFFSPAAIFKNYINARTMPTLLEETEVRLEMADLDRRVHISSLGTGIKGQLREVAERRSSGVHLSGVLRYIAIKLKILEAYGKIEDDLPLLPALGFAWEEFAVSLYPEIDHQPGEVCLDGVYMNCDGLGIFNPPDALGPSGEPEWWSLVDEFKYTRKKRASGVELMSDKKHWLWMQQLKGYCNGYGAEYARLHVCFANGDCSWGESGQPVYMRYLFRFSTEELAQMWRMVQQNKQYAEAERH